MDILAKYFSVREGARSTENLGAEDQDHQDHEKCVDETPQPDGHGNDRHEESHETCESEVGEDDQVVELDGYGGPAEDDESVGDTLVDPMTPRKNPPNVDVDPMNESLAFRMGGETMLKPTPSPGSPWTHRKPEDRAKEIDFVQSEIDRLE